MSKAIDKLAKILYGKPVAHHQIRGDLDARIFEDAACEIERLRLIAGEDDPSPSPRRRKARKK